MTTKTLTGTYTSQYYLTKPITTLSIAASGYLEAGVHNYSGHPYTIINSGRVNSSTGYAIEAGGVIDNYGTITGRVGVRSYGQITNHGLIQCYSFGVQFGSTVANYGTITSSSAGSVGVFGLASFPFNESLTNGSLNDTTALISAQKTGVNAHYGTVHNYGTILGGAGGHGANIYGATLSNGGGSDTTALISGYVGVRVYYSTVSGSTVTNFGDISGTGSAVGSYGVQMVSGDLLTNGSAAGPPPRIQGYAGVGVIYFTESVLAGTVVNYGTIAALGAQAGVTFAIGGLVSNGSGADADALIQGAEGVAFSVAATLVNFGVVDGASGIAALFQAGGTVVNGDPAHQTAVILGDYGIVGASSVTNFGVINSVKAGFAGVYSTLGAKVTNGANNDTNAMIYGAAGVWVLAPGTVGNYATIEGSISAGVAVYGGAVTNGDGVDHSALIKGVTGVVVQAAAGAVRNFGTVEATGGAGDYGVYLQSGGSLTNGSSSNNAALIEGSGGVHLSATGEVTNFGTISGSGGTAVLFSSSADVLAVEAGSTFIGKVLGGGGLLDLASGTGTLTGLLAGGNVTVSGSMPTTTFTNFGAVEVGPGASFTLAGTSSIAKGQRLIVAGTLTSPGALINAGVLVTSGTLRGAGILSLTGAAVFNTGASLTITRVNQSGPASASFGTPSLTYAGQWSQKSGTTSVSTGDRVNFSGAGDSFAGTLAGAGTVAFVGGSDSLTGTTLSATSLIINGSSVNLSGTITLSHALAATTANLVVATGGATLSGGGTLILTNAATNRFYGASAAATLTNNDRIQGAGLLGNGTMILVNNAAGIIVGDDSIALTIDTGVATITNAGLIQATSTGGVFIQSAVANTGVLAALGGNLTAAAAVSGSGTVKISAGTADFSGTFSENVAFTGTTGILELAKSQAFAGQVTGFSKTGGTSFDLEDIVFGAKTKATYAGTATSGTLTVTDGTHTAKITLVGNYLSSTFKVSKDASGGTIVVDPAASASTIHPFIAATAGFGAPRGGAVAAPAEAWRPPPQNLTAPRPQFA